MPSQPRIQVYIPKSGEIAVHCMSTCTNIIGSSARCFCMLISNIAQIMYLGTWLCHACLLFAKLSKCFEAPQKLVNSHLKTVECARIERLWIRII